VEYRGCREFRAAPISEILIAEKGRINGQIAAFLRQLTVKARLVLRAQRVGLCRLRLIASASWVRPSQ
jgi:hypothetical protein